MTHHHRPLVRAMINYFLSDDDELGVNKRPFSHFFVYDAPSSEYGSDGEVQVTLNHDFDRYEWILVVTPSGSFLAPREKWLSKTPVDNKITLSVGRDMTRIPLVIASPCDDERVVGGEKMSVTRECVQCRVSRDISAFTKKIKRKNKEGVPVEYVYTNSMSCNRCRVNATRLKKKARPVVNDEMAT